MPGVEIIVPLAFFATVAAIVLGLRWFAYKTSHSSLPAQDAAGLAAVEQRLARVEVALDDLASELTRVTEGQQFLTKVLTDRSADAVVGALPQGTLQR
jgi:hypothetical protein